LGVDLDGIQPEVSFGSICFQLKSHLWHNWRSMVKGEG